MNNLPIVSITIAKYCSNAEKMIMESNGDCRQNVSEPSLSRQRIWNTVISALVAQISRWLLKNS